MVGRRLDDLGRGLASSPRLTHLWRRSTGALGSLADQDRAGWSGRAPLEYWFFRTSWADGALLVDVISRRHEGTVELRVSSQNHGTAQINRLVRQHRTGPASDPAQVVDCELTLRSSRGSCGPIAWDLGFAAALPRLSAPPTPWRQWGTFDLALTSWPLAAATGSVTMAGRTEHLVGRPAMLCHYWGRELPRRWLWLSANDFDQSDLALEVGVLRSKAWGRRVPLPALGYAWLHDSAGTRMVASPIDGLVRYAPRPQGGVDLSITGLAGRWQVQAWAANNSFVHLGEGIAQSLSADLLMVNRFRRAVAHGTAILEVRDEAWAATGPPTVDPARSFTHHQRPTSRPTHGSHEAT
jgi:hypothetical protein